MRASVHANRVTAAITADSQNAWTLMAIGFFFLALDDLTQIHERLDKALNRYFGLDLKATCPDLVDAGIVRATGACVAMVILDVLGDLVDERYTKVVVAILEDGFEALAVSRFFWTFVTARFQLRQPDKYLADAPAPLCDATAGSAAR